MNTMQQYMRLNLSCGSRRNRNVQVFDECMKNMSTIQNFGEKRLLELPHVVVL